MAPRPALVLVLLLALLCSHIALCSSAASGIPKRKDSSGGRKALLAASDDDGGEDAPAVVVKPAAAAKKEKAAASGKIKKKVVDADAKNQTKAAAKTKKPESSAATAAKGSTTKKTSTSTTKKTSTKGSGDGALAKAKVPKVPKVPKADKAKGAAADSAKPAPKVSKSSGAGGKAVEPAAKSEGAAAAAGAKAKKPSNSTAKPGVKKAPVVEGKASSSSAKVNATASKDKEVDEEEDVVFAAEEAAGTDDDLISEFRGLPARLQETLMPDLARLSHQSKAYLSAANAGIADGVRPILGGGRWAAAAASAASVAALLLPLCMLTALVRRMGAVLPLLHRALLLAQAYLAIYFATLALAAAATGLEPLRFFHAASPAAYAWTQVAQSLGFVAYLLLQMVDLVAVFSGAAAPPGDEDGGVGGDAGKALGLAQMVVGLAVGLHYYAAVFHRAAAGEAPRANWRVYAVYAACFVVICACARAERRKKAYLADGAAEEWKKS